MKTYIRRINESDISRVAELETSIWPVEMQASENKLRRRFSKFPEGFLGAFNGSVLIGASSSMIISYKEFCKYNTWYQITDDGYIGNHDPNGNLLYLVSIGVHPTHQRKGIGSSLIKAQLTLAADLRLDYVGLGSRNTEQNIKFYVKNNFNLEKEVNIFICDAEANNMGVIMLHELKSTII